MSTAEPNIIGRGLQFTVFDEGDRVRKKYNSIRVILKLLTHADPQSVVNPLGLGREARRIARERDDAVAEFARREFDHAIVANATMRGRTIVQDKVIPFGEQLKSGVSHFALVDQLVATTLEGWRQGLCETSFNFTVNHGVTADGRVVIIDIGEITFDRDIAIKHIRDKFWEKAWSFTSDISDDVRKYVSHAFDDKLTVSALEETWIEAPIIGAPRPPVEE